LMSCWGSTPVFLPHQLINVSFQSLPWLSQSLLTVSPPSSHHSRSFIPSISSMSPSSPSPDSLNLF
jgi:hypothetical protein